MLWPCRVNPVAAYNLSGRGEREMSSIRMGLLALCVLGWATMASAQNGPLTVLPDGTKLVYVFTGVSNDDTGSDLTATIVSCTNLGSDATDVTVQIFAGSGALSGTGTAAGLAPGATEVFESSNTAHMSQAIQLNAGSIVDTGSGRILATAKKPQLACNAVVSDTGTAATFMADLPMIPAKKGPKVKPFKE